MGRRVSMSLARSMDARVICEEDIGGSHANAEDRFRHLDMVRIMHAQCTGFQNVGAITEHLRWNI